MHSILRLRIVCHTPETETERNDDMKKQRITAMLAAGLMLANAGGTLQLPVCAETNAAAPPAAILTEPLFEGSAMATPVTSNSGI